MSDRLVSIASIQRVVKQLRKIYQDLVEEGYHYPNQLLEDIDNCIMDLGGTAEHKEDER